ncbi:MAG TPA: mucoidy inhibitor MuiA family protein [Desulfosalsimonadaceae bacterium]|nr:mucoidy inhibitor MuiA family protein [Desulfosalsimonadaceae bacterium]
MKRIPELLVLMLFLSSIPVQANTLVHSRIAAVTLYSGQALVQREATIEAESGVNTLELPINAFSIDAPSATAKVFGKGRIISVQVKTVPLPAPPQQKIRELEDRIEKLNQEKQAVLDRKKAASRQEAFLDAVSEFSQTQVPKDLETRMLDPEALTATFELLGDRFHEVYRRMTEFDREIAKIEADIRVARRQLSELRNPGDDRQQVIEVVFDSAEKQQIRILADYVAYNAHWAPVYRVAVPQEKEAVDLTMNARIVQKTGEDWSDVTLSISNAVPLRGVSLPSLSTWWLDLPRPRVQAEAPQSAGRQTFGKLMRAQPEAEMAKKETAIADAAEYAAARKKDAGTAFEYELTRPVSVASRQKETLLPLYTKALSGKFFYYCVPRINTRAYLVSEVKPDKEMLAGPMHVYFAGHYMGKTQFNPESRDNRFLLALGADRAVQVRRKKVADQVDETLFGKFERSMVVRELGYRISIENRKEESVQIRLLDQVPVAKTDKIEVEDMAFDPEPDEKDYQDQSGVMMWQMEVNSQASESIDIGFTVAYPKDQPPVGL